MSLRADVALRMGSLEVNAEMVARKGQVVGLLGANAAGKTSLLRALAGLTSLQRGRVVLDEKVIEDTATAVHVPTEQRPLGMVFQDYLLFPHLSVIENVAFGLRCRGASRADARRRASEWLERVGLAGKERMRPRALSGGQAQRVALARALVTEPKLLLLDEPLAALDAGARAELRRELHRHLSCYEGVCVLVTHDPIEAMTLADQLVVLEAGHVSQAGTPAEVSAHPRSRYVADLVGLNLFRGVALGGGVIELPGGQRLVAAADEPCCGQVFAMIHPHAVALYRTRPDGSPRNVWPGSAEPIDVTGDRVRVRIDGPVSLVGEITPAALTDLNLGAGGQVWAAVKATEIQVYPA